ncbi:YeeE/YedE [Magnetospirillum sp. UT-4]|nr:YeeE/YedE family protein [Magnetospirillum sp. UT-4]CAA7623064.1 YeeE/YedE [Magnetospirillum sp. UT-4]
MSELPISTVVGLAAFLVGIVFGATAQRTNFCTMGALSDIVFMGDWNRFRAWMLAVAVGVLATQAMDAAGLITIGKSIYLAGAIAWAGAVLGGLMFGFGMTLAGGCGNKTLVRIGGGNLKSVMTFMIVGLFAYMTLKGLIGLARVQLEAVANVPVAGIAANQGIPALLAAMGLPKDIAQWGATLAVGLGLLVFCFKDHEFRSSPRDIIGGLIIGLMVPAGWWVTGVLGNDEFDPTPLSSFTFVAPIGDTLQYLMTFSGSTINFGIAAVGGVIAGSFLSSITSKSFHIEAFSDAPDMLRHMLGAALMGTGGVLAMGCTIGQGLTGMSTLSLTSLIALASILFGGVWGLKYMEEGSVGGALKAVFARG